MQHIRGDVMQTFDAILEGWQVDNDEVAIDYANGADWCNYEISEQDIKYKRYIDTVNGVGVWYDYGADYYFFTDETIK